MSYTDVITLDRAKNYLRLDNDFDDDDNEIISMINGACSYIEKRTNHIFYERDKEFKGACQVKVFDYPVNSVITDPIPFFVDFSLSTVYPDVKEVVLNVGYADGEVPDELIQACLQLIKTWYFESEKQVNSTLIPESVKEVIDIYKRFL